MSTEKIYSKLVHKVFNPPKPKISRLAIKSEHYISRKKLVTPPGVSTGVTPSIFPYTEPVNGYKYSKGDRKAKRKWYANYRNFRLPVTILAKDEAEKTEREKARELQTMTGVRMRLRLKEMKKVEEAGGLEAKLVSSPSKYFSDEGRLLRSALIQQLHRIRRASEEGYPEGQGGVLAEVKRLEGR